MKGTAADQAGVKAGDIIEYLDNKATRDISLYDAKGLLNGAAGTEVKLRVLRANSSPLTLSVKRGGVHAAAAEARMDAGKAGILRIKSFAYGESTEIKHRLQDRVKQGARKSEVGMRHTPGGSLNEAVTVPSLFIRDGPRAQAI